MTTQNKKTTTEEMIRLQEDTVDRIIKRIEEAEATLQTLEQLLEGAQKDLAASHRLSHVN